MVVYMTTCCIRPRKPNTHCVVLQSDQEWSSPLEMHRQHYKDPYPHPHHRSRSRSPSERHSRSHYKLRPEDRYEKIPHDLDMRRYSREKASKPHLYRDMEQGPKDTWRHHRDYDDLSPQELRPRSPLHRHHQSHSPRHDAHQERNIRITVGNDKFQSDSPPHQLASAHARLGPPVERLYSVQSLHDPPASRERTESSRNDIDDGGLEELQMARLRKQMKEEVVRERMKQNLLEDMERRLHLEKYKLAREQSTDSGYILHKPNITPAQPKKSILKKIDGRDVTTEQLDSEADVLRRYQREPCDRKMSSSLELAASGYNMNTSCIPGIADFDEVLNEPSTEIKSIDDEEQFLYGDDGKDGRQLERHIAIDRQTVSRSDKYKAEKPIVNEVEEHCTVSAPPSNTFAGNDGKSEQRLEQDLAAVLHTIGLNLGLSELTQLIMAKKQTHLPSSHEPISKPSPKQPTPTESPLKEPQQYKTPVYPSYPPPSAFFGNVPVPASSMAPAPAPAPLPAPTPAPSTPTPSPYMASSSAPPMAQSYPIGFPWSSTRPVPMNYCNVGRMPGLPIARCLHPSQLQPNPALTQNMSKLFQPPPTHPPPPHPPPPHPHPPPPLPPSPLPPSPLPPKIIPGIRSNLRLIETVDLDAKKESPPVPSMVHHPISTPSTSQPSYAVQIKTEEKENLAHVTQERQKRLTCLEQELKKLRKQQGEIERMKQKEKDGHKDPALLALGLLQQQVAEEIARTRSQVAAAAQRQMEFDKTGVLSLEQHAKKPMNVNSTDVKVEEKKKEEGILGKKEDKFEEDFMSRVEFFDGGNHWCKLCNTLFVDFNDLFFHLHTKKHRQMEDILDRPWANVQKSNIVTKSKILQKVPGKGAEFIMPVRAYYCKLCDEFYGDPSSTQHHVTSPKHNLQFERYSRMNPNYLHRWRKDRAAAMAVIKEDKRRLIVEEKRKQYEDSQQRKTKLMKILEKEKQQFVELDEMKTDGGTDASSKTQIKLTLRVTEDKKKVAEGESEKCAATKAKEVIGRQEAKKEAFSSKASKQISINLSGKTFISPPVTNVPPVASQPRIRPKLPLVPISQRKPSSLVPQTMQRPVPLNMFLSIGGKYSAKPLPVVKEDRLMQQQQPQVMMQKQEKKKELKEECKPAITQVVEEDKEGLLKIPDINLETATENVETVAVDNVENGGLDAEIGDFQEIAAVDKGKEGVNSPLEEESFEKGSVENISSVEVEREQPVAMEIDMTSDKVKNEEEENPEKSCVIDKASMQEECAPGTTDVLDSVLAIPVPPPSISNEQPVAMEIDMTSDKVKKEEEEENSEKSCVIDKASMQECAPGTTDVLESELAIPVPPPSISNEQPVAMKIDMTSDEVKKEEEDNPENSCVIDKASMQEECAPGTTEVLDSVLAIPVPPPSISNEQPVAMEIDMTSDLVEKEEEEENSEKSCVIDKASMQECAPGTTDVLESEFAISVPPPSISNKQPVAMKIDMTSDIVKKEEEGNPENSCVIDKASMQECAPGTTDILESELTIPVPPPSISNEQPVAMKIDMTSDKVKKEEEENPEKSCVIDKASMQEECAPETTEVLDSVLAIPVPPPSISNEQPVAMEIDMASDKVKKEEEEENSEKSCVIDKASMQEECAPGTTEVLESVLAIPVPPPLTLDAQQPMTRRQMLVASAKAQDLCGIFYSGTNAELKFPASAPSAATPCVVSKIPSPSSDNIGTEEQADGEDTHPSLSSKEET